MTSAPVAPVGGNRVSVPGNGRRFSSGKPPSNLSSVIAGPAEKPTTATAGGDPRVAEEKGPGDKPEDNKAEEQQPPPEVPDTLESLLQGLTEQREALKRNSAIQANVRRRERRKEELHRQNGHRQGSGVSHPAWRRPCTVPEPLSKAPILPPGRFLNPYEALNAMRPVKTYAHFAGEPFLSTSNYPHEIKDKPHLAKTAPPGGWRPKETAKELSNNHSSNKGGHLPDAPPWVVSRSPRPLDNKSAFLGGVNEMHRVNLKKRLNVRDDLTVLGGSAAQFRTGGPAETYITIPRSKPL